MRLIHTSDWHLGQALHNFERGFEHKHFLDWLVLTLQAEQADCLLISGDIFDNANPSAAAQKQLYLFLQRAKAALPRLNIVIIAGNHDSPGRLEAPGPLLDDQGIRVIGQVPRLPDGQIDLARLVLPLHDSTGKVAAWCLAIPFLRPGDVPRSNVVGGLDDMLKNGREHETADPAVDPYVQGIALLYRQALAYALHIREQGQAIIAMGHCHMVGGGVSENSERRIMIGGTQALSAAIFGPEISYAALGHLHLAQRVAQQEHLRYCGSPIPLSFAEVGYTHQVLRIDLTGESLTECVALTVPRAVQLLRVPAYPAPLDDVLQALAALDIPVQDDQESYPFLEVRVRLDAPEPGLRTRIETALEGKHIRLARIETSFIKSSGDISDLAEPVRLDELDRLQPDVIFNRLYLSRYDMDAPPLLRAAFGELMLPPPEELI